MLTYFDLFKPRAARAEAAGMASVSRQLLIYLSVVVGILVVPLVEDVALSLEDAISLRNILVAMIIGLAIFPTAYRAAFDRTSPILSQCGLAVMTGIGWENIISTALKASDAPVC